MVNEASSYIYVTLNLDFQVIIFQRNRLMW